MAVFSGPWLALPPLLLLLLVSVVSTGGRETSTEYLVNVILIQNEHLPWSLDKVSPSIALGIEHANQRLRLAGLNARINATYSEFLSHSENPEKVCVDTDCEAKEVLQTITEEELLGCAVIGPTCQYAAYGLLRAIKRYERMVVSAGSFGLSTSFMPELTRTLLSAVKVSTFFVDFWRLVSPRRKRTAWSTAYVLSGSSYNYDVCLWYVQALLENIKTGSGNITFNSMKLEMNHHVIEVPTLEKLSLALMNRESNVVIFCGDASRVLEVTSFLENSLKDIFHQLIFVNLDLFGCQATAERNYTIPGRVLVVTLPSLNISLPVTEQETNASSTERPQVNKFAEAYYETMLIYGDFLQRSLQDGTFNCSSTDATVMRGQNYSGKNRRVHIDAHGDSEGELEVLYLHNNKFYVAWQYDTWHNTFREVSTLNFTLPTDVPARKTIQATIIALVTISILFIVLTLGFLLLWRKYSVERQLRTQRWVIPWVKLEDLPEDEINITHEVRERKLRVNFVGDGDFEPDVVTKKKYDNKVVMLKPLYVYDKEFTNTQKRELCLLMSMASDNLTKFYGTTVGDIGVTYIVTDYCCRGSLWDILREEVTYPEETLMDWDFKVSIMHDIAKGMVYLQNKIGAHGRLKSINCVVDSRMVVKVTDFGLLREREDGSCSLKATPHPDSGVKEKKISYAQLLKARTRGQNKLFNKFITRRSNPCNEMRPPSPCTKLWTAPEHLREDGVSPKGDVYSFAIILQELIYRRGVFYVRDDCPSESEIIERLISAKDAAGHFRPTLEESVIADKVGGSEIYQMVSDCWDEHPDRRPDFKRVEGILRKVSNKIHQGRGGTYVDSLIWRLEQYSKNLERLVEERTQLYKRERDRADELNFQLLPKSVVTALKTRGSVEPELFDAVTIYFSDIVGFTTICKHSEPMEVICLLNDLYKAFDTIVDSYDVYKVETIGDAYMVVSGLPRRNGLRHAAHIADMALDILGFVGTFQVEHLPGLPLWVRIGIHSGGCAAGVVGNRMPRYCLFGDTVNTASRIESTGLPWRIHVSSSTVKILAEIESGHVFEERGLTELKGRGSEVTYWLIGNEAFNKRLPVPPEIDIGHGLKGEFEEMIKDIKKKRGIQTFMLDTRSRSNTTTTTTTTTTEEHDLEYLQILVPNHDDTLL